MNNRIREREGKNGEREWIQENIACGRFSKRGCERERDRDRQRERDRQRGRGSGESLHRLRPVFARFLKTDRAFPIKGATRVACTPGVTIGYRDTPRKTIAGRPCSVAHRLFTLAPLRGNDRPSIERAFHPPRYENRADQRRNLVSILSISRSRAPNYSRDTHTHTRLEQQSRKGGVSSYVSR